MQNNEESTNEDKIKKLSKDRLKIEVIYTAIVIACTCIMIPEISIMVLITVIEPILILILSESYIQENIYLKYMYKPIEAQCKYIQDYDDDKKSTIAIFRYTKNNGTNAVKEVNITKKDNYKVGETYCFLQNKADEDDTRPLSFKKAYKSIELKQIAFLTMWAIFRILLIAIVDSLVLHNTSLNILRRVALVSVACIIAMVYIGKILIAMITKKKIKAMEAPSH